MNRGGYTPGNGPGAHPSGGSSGRAALLLGIALVLGIVVLNATDQGGGSSASLRTATGVSTTQARGSASSLPAVTVPARAPRPAAEVKVLPVNASGVTGLGGKVADRLKRAGFTNTLSAVTGESQGVATSSVQYADDSEPEARLVAVALGLPATVVKALDSPPVRDTRGADVVVVVGKDLNQPTTSSTSARSTTNSSARSTTNSSTARSTTSSSTSTTTGG